MSVRPSVCPSVGRTCRPILCQNGLTYQETVSLWRVALSNDTHRRAVALFIADALAVERDKYKSIAHDLDTTFTELAGYWLRLTHVTCCWLYLSVSLCLSLSLFLAHQLSTSFPLSFSFPECTQCSLCDWFFFLWHRVPLYTRACWCHMELVHGLRCAGDVI